MANIQATAPATRSVLRLAQDDLRVQMVERSTARFRNVARQNAAILDFVTQHFHQGD